LISGWILDVLSNFRTGRRYLVKYPGYPPSNLQIYIKAKIWLDSEFGGQPDVQIKKSGYPIGHISNKLTLISNWILDILSSIPTETRYLVKYPGYPPSDINTEIHQNKISVWFDLFKYLVEYKISGQIYETFGNPISILADILQASKFGILPDAVHKKQGYLIGHTFSKGQILNLIN
jgi:hypothetical protein